MAEDCDDTDNEPLPSIETLIAISKRNRATTKAGNKLGTEGGMANQSPPSSSYTTEEANDCHYQDGENGCQDLDHGAVDAPLGDVRSYRSTASQGSEYSQSLEGVLPRLLQKGKRKKRRRSRLSPTAVENSPSKRPRFSQSESQPPHTEENAYTAHMLEERKSKVTIIRKSLSHRAY